MLRSRWAVVVVGVLCAICAAVEGCDDAGPASPPTAWPADDVAIVVADGADDAVRWAADDLQAWIESATGARPELAASPGATRAPYLVLVGEGPWGCPVFADAESYAIQETRHAGRPALRLCGGGLLGQQYAVYAYLFALGVRFVHPEQTFVPALEALPPGLPPGTTSRIQTPGLALRGFHQHTQHPLELLEALLTDDPDEAERAYRYVDWLVRNRQNLLQWILLNSVPPGETFAQAARVADYAHRRGVSLSAVTSFNEAQQNAHLLIDTTDEGDDLEELRAGLDQIVDAGFDRVVINIGSTEFSESDDVETVGWMDETAAYMAETAPGVVAYASNHVPADVEAATYGVNFYDLPQFADRRLGTYVHTTMCYGLEGPAPVYGNEDFARQRDYLLDQVDVRPIVYYPESAWWLTFDNAIPLSPAMYLHARAADLRFLASVEGVEGHVTFSSGFEWGYWLTDLLIARQDWAPDASIGLEAALDELLGPLDGQARLGPALARMAEAEWAALVEGGLMPFLTAEDLPTEIGYRAGIVFHDLAPLPADVMRYDADGLDGLAARLDELEAFCEELAPVEAELGALRGEGTTAHDVVAPQARTGPAKRPAAISAAPILEELHDGAAITLHRCRNALANYRALVASRSAQLELPAEDPTALLAAAAAGTAAAAEIVTRRETAYRYEPARVSDHEDTGGAGVDNVTDYDYRVNGRTHGLFFWHRRDALVVEAIEGITRQLVVAPQQTLAGAAVAVDSGSAGFDGDTDVGVAWGDGAQETMPAGGRLEHVFAAPAQPTLVVTASAEDQPVTIARPLSIATRLYTLPADSLHLLDPPDMIAEAALRPFLPTMQLGFNSDVADAAPLASLAFDRDGDGEADDGTVAHLPPGRRDGGHVVFEGFDLAVSVEASAGDFGSLHLRDATLDLELGTTLLPDDTVVSCRLRAAVVVEELIAIVVGTGVFDREGVVAILADIFGFDPAEVPEVVTVEFSVEGSLTASL